MAISISCVVPHPPILLPEIGGAHLTQIKETEEAMKKLSSLIAEADPETLVFISPHSTAFADFFAVKTDSDLKGSFAQFGAASVKIEAKNDVELAEQIISEAKTRDLSAVDLGEVAGGRFGASGELDHGILVPLYYIRASVDVPLVSLSISGMDYLKHYLLGVAVRDAAEKTKRKVAFIASGDFSHRLTEQAPAGFNPRGKEFDEKLVGIVRRAAFKELFELDDDLVEAAGECGLRSIFVLAGIFNGYEVDSQILSYEGPFGVGYSVAALKEKNKSEACDSLKILLGERERINEKADAQESLPVRLARRAVETYVREKKTVSLPRDLPAYLKGRTGAFVSIKKQGELRGCIGTTAPTQPDSAHEITRNAISAATQDPRFSPLDESELASLTYSVDILEQPEEVKSKTELDPKEYGVIVKSDWRTGLLLPDLEGVETVEQQVDIARRKAGIPSKEKVRLYRFKVRRYY